MSYLNKSLLLFTSFGLMLAGFLLAPTQLALATEHEACFCSTDATQATTAGLNNGASKAECSVALLPKTCSDQANALAWDSCSLQISGTECYKKVTEWEEQAQLFARLNDNPGPTPLKCLCSTDSSAATTVGLQSGNDKAQCLAGATTIECDLHNAAGLWAACSLKADALTCEADKNGWYDRAKLSAVNNDPVGDAVASTAACFCSTDISKATPAAVEKGEAFGQCVAATSIQDCISAKPDPATCEWQDTSDQCAAVAKQWNDEFNLNNKQAATPTAGRSSAVSGGLVHSIIPECLFEDVLPPHCRDVSVFIDLLIGFGKIALSIIGSFALAFFIYGGFVLIMSQGNPEKVKKGAEIMLGAVIGLFIAFAGYLLIQFMGEAIGLRDKFRLK